MPNNRRHFVHKRATAKSVNDSIADWLGARPASDYELVGFAENGLPLTTVQRMVERGLTRDEVHSIVIPERTLKHRKARHQRLTKEESDRAIRAALLLARAGAVFGSSQDGLNWMRGPKRRFGNRPPIELMASETGARVVEEMLVQIDQGIFA
jgi:putative toxin-antitoxin system antitoxin component (TIGR02293 family)